MATPVKFGAWEPDKSTHTTGVNEAKGVIAQQGDYVPIRALAQYAGNTLNGTCIGGFGCYDTTSQAQVVLGSSSKLYALRSGALVDVSKGGGYATPADLFWSFEQFGQYLVASFRDTAMQVADLSTVNWTFANLAGSPPQAETVGRVLNFLVCGYDQTLTWSAQNDITSWTPSTTTQAGTTTLDISGGKIKRIFGGETGTVLQQRHIRRMTYVGPPTIWQIDLVEERRGVIAQNGAVKFGRNIFYASEDGFYVFDGYQSQPIGINKVDEYFTSNLNYPYRHHICCAFDPVQRTVIWAIPTGSNAYPSELIIYSISDDRWTHDDISAEYLFEMPIPGYTVDNLYQFPGAVESGNIDKPSLSVIPIDSPVFSEGRRQPAAVDLTHTMCTFSGVNRPAILETQEINPEPGRRAFVSEIWPVVDAATQSVSASVRYRANSAGDGVTESTATTANASGLCPQRVDGRYLRGRVYLSSGASWNHAEGINATVSVSGAR